MKRIEIYGSSYVDVINVTDILAITANLKTGSCVLYSTVFKDGTYFFKDIREVLQFIDDDKQTVLIIK